MSSGGARKPGFFSRLLQGAKNIFGKILPVASTILGFVNPGLGKLAGIAGKLIGGSRGRRISDGLSRASDITGKIGGVVDQLRPAIPKQPVTHKVLR